MLSLLHPILTPIWPNLSIFCLWNPDTYQNNHLCVWAPWGRRLLLNWTGSEVSIEYTEKAKSLRAFWGKTCFYSLLLSSTWAAAEAYCCLWSYDVCGGICAEIWDFHSIWNKYRPFKSNLSMKLLQTEIASILPIKPLGLGKIGIDTHLTRNFGLYY